MKKSNKLLLGLLVFILIVATVIFFLTGVFDLGVFKYRINY